MKPINEYLGTRRVYHLKTYLAAWIRCEAEAAEQPRDQWLVPGLGISKSFVLSISQPGAGRALVLPIIRHYVLEIELYVLNTAVPRGYFKTDVFNS